MRMDKTRSATMLAPGYDQATGLGSFDANALVNNWQAASATLGSTTTLQLASASPVVHGTPITFNAAVKCSGSGCTDPTGTVSLSATPTAGGSPLLAGQGSLTPGTPTSSSTIQTQKVPGGTYNVTARYSGDGTYYSSSSAPVQVTVTPEPSQTYLGALGGGSYNLTPSSITYDEPLLLGFVVAGNSGFGYPSGTLSLQEDGQPVGTVLANGTTPSPITLNYGENSPLLTGTSATASQASTISYLKPGSPVGTHQLVASYPGDNSFSSGTSNTYSLTVTKATSVIADFFPYSTPIANVPVMIGGQVALTNYCAPFGGTITITDITSTPIVVSLGTPGSALLRFLQLPRHLPHVGYADYQSRLQRRQQCESVVRDATPPSRFTTTRFLPPRSVRIYPPRRQALLLP